MSVRAGQTFGHHLEIVASDQHVSVSRDGVLLAESRRPVVLRETGLPPRYYLPPEDVRMDLLTPSEKHTECPFKGTASYWSARLGDETLPDFVWSYPDPIPAARPIAGLMCFYNEKVDLEVDGEPQPRPTTPWS